MGKCILILTLVWGGTGRAVDIETAVFDDKRACVDAGRTWKETLPGGKGSWLCAPYEYEEAQP
jgi:hypothetical protein